MRRSLALALLPFVLLAGCADTPEPDTDKYMEEIAVYELDDPVEIGMTMCSIVADGDVWMLIEATEPGSDERAIALGVMATAVSYLCPEYEAEAFKQLDI